MIFLLGLLVGLLVGGLVGYYVGVKRAVKKVTDALYATIAEVLDDNANPKDI